MVEMPFVNIDIEDEFAVRLTSEVNLKKKRKRTTGRENEEDNERKKKKKEQYRPNFFISIPITNSEISGGVQAVQDTIIQKDHRLSKAMVHCGSLHVTLLVMHLSSKEEVSTAVDALSDSKDLVEDLLKGKTVDLSFQGIDHFRNEVGFVKLAESDHTAILMEIAETIKKIFQEKGILAGGDRAFKPHLTFMKLSKSPKLRKEVKKIDPSLYEKFKSHYFGDEILHRLDLCSMLKKKQPNGYYYCESCVILVRLPFSTSRQELQDGAAALKTPGITGEKHAAEPDDAELVSLSKRLVENAVLKAVQQYLEETQNKNKQTDGSPVKTEEATSGRKNHGADLVKEALHRETQALLSKRNQIKKLLSSPEIRMKISKELFEDRHNYTSKGKSCTDSGSPNA
ncbi:A-kinase anchoring protein 7 isoform X5 [Apteryx rowi]|nr:A-kinase anchoring protein 7 isoform X5 [Apteryx rowi]